MLRQFQRLVPAKDESTRCHFEQGAPFRLLLPDVVSNMCLVIFLYSIDLFIENEIPGICVTPFLHVRTCPYTSICAQQELFGLAGSRVVAMAPVVAAPAFDV